MCFQESMSVHHPSTGSTKITANSSPRVPRPSRSSNSTHQTPHGRAASAERGTRSTPKRLGCPRGLAIENDPTGGHINCRRSVMIIIDLTGLTIGASKGAKRAGVYSHVWHTYFKALASASIGSIATNMCSFQSPFPPSIQFRIKQVFGRRTRKCFA